MCINVIYEDNHLIIVEKEPGVLTQGASLDLPVLFDLVKDYLKTKYQKEGNVFLGIVQRLDTNVGGLVCFAKTSKAASRISKEIRELKYEKKYLTIVESNKSLGSNTLIDYLSKDEKNKKAIITNKKIGRESILKYQELVRIGNLSLLEVELITGRFHQIRVQLANIGSPILGDFKYGSKKKLENISLYAYGLKFKHPTKDEIVEIKHLPKSDIYQQFLKKIDLS